MFYLVNGCKYTLPYLFPLISTSLSFPPLSIFHTHTHQHPPTPTNPPHTHTHTYTHTHTITHSLTHSISLSSLLPTFLFLNLFSYFSLFLHSVPSQWRADCSPWIASGSLSLGRTIQKCACMEARKWKYRSVSGNVEVLLNAFHALVWATCSALHGTGKDKYTRSQAR